jgi:hypothetical protein
VYGNISTNGEEMGVLLRRRLTQTPDSALAREDGGGAPSLPYCLPRAC